MISVTDHRYRETFVEAVDEDEVSGVRVRVTVDLFVDAESVAVLERVRRLYGSAPTETLGAVVKLQS